MRLRASLLRLGLLPMLVLLSAAAPPLAFIRLGAEQSGAVEEYEGIWATEGAAIVEELEKASGLAFPAGRIDVIVSDGPPMTSYDGRTIRLRGSYSPLYKRATLVHELGHILTFGLANRAGLDEHRLLYLFLYDVWSDLYGTAFADRMVAVEKRIPGPVDYRAAWDWALSQTREQRRARLAALRGPPRLSREALRGVPRLSYEDVLPPEPLPTPRPSGEVEGM